VSDLLLCRVSADLLAHMAIEDQCERYDDKAQRDDAMKLAKQFLEGKATLRGQYYNSEDEFTHDDLMVAVWDHALYEKAFFSHATGNPAPLSDLIQRCANHAAAVHLFGEERADELFDF
jgi:glutathione S-transferase